MWGDLFQVYLSSISSGPDRASQAYLIKFLLGERSNLFFALLISNHVISSNVYT